MAFDKSKYDQEYRRQYVVKKLISFNTKVEDDMQLMKWLETQPENMTQYIKRLIREDAEKRGVKLELLCKMQETSE